MHGIISGYQKVERRGGYEEFRKVVMGVRGSEVAEKH
jgi:hypothetical protein